MVPESSPNDGERRPSETVATAFPELSERVAAFEAWKRDVRDPAGRSTEGVRRVGSRDGKAVAEYEIAPLPDGRWAVRLTCQFRTGDCSGIGIPWSDFATREECVALFLSFARQHFTHETGPASVRTEMRERLRETLYGFEEPAPEKSLRE